MIDERTMMGLVAGIMVLILVGGGLARRRLPAGSMLRLGLLWAAIIVGATVIAMLGQKLIHGS